MSISFWIVLWKAVFIVGVGLFSVLAVVVTIGGMFDIRRLFRTLHKQHRDYLEEKSRETAP